MKPYKLTIKFYILFFLILLVPFLYLNKLLSHLLNLLPSNTPLDHLKDFGLLDGLSLFTFFFLLFYFLDRYLWKIRPINFLFATPHIGGRYEGDLSSSYNDTKKYKVIIEIRQSLTNISISLFTANSSSYSIVANLGKNEHDNWALFYVYQNRVNTVNHDEDMKNHEGFACLDILDNKKILKGYYFNNPRDRGRNGNIEVKYVDRVVKKSFK